MTESLCCRVETNTTVYINDASIKAKQTKKHMMFPVNTSISRKANKKKTTREIPIKTRLFASASVRMRWMNLLYRVN